MRRTHEAHSLVDAIYRSNREVVRDLLMAQHPDPERWTALSSSLYEGAALTNGAKKEFHSVWIEFGAKIRIQVGDDRMLTHLLRSLLPEYHGEGLRLYRGENADRYAEGHIGFCWTPEIKKAQMFGRGLNAWHGTGGVLLSAMVDHASIIAEPNAHSIYLGEHEYTIDPFSLSNVEMLDRYPPC